MLKLTSMNNTLPPINTHSRSSLDDIRGVGTGGTAESSLPSKQHQIRRQQTIDQQRRNPLKTNRLLPSTGSKYVTTSPTVVGPVGASPFASVSPLIRSPSIVNNGSPAQNDSSRTIYRSTDCVPNDHSNQTYTSNQQLRSNSPIKNKLAALSQRLTNETLHESSVVTTGRSTLQPSLPAQLQQRSRDDVNNGDLFLPSTGKSYHAIRRRHTNSFLDKSPGATDYNSFIRKDTDRSPLLTNGIRSRQISSKQRNYVNSKTSFYEVNERDLYASGTLDTTAQQPSLITNTQRLYDSSYDVTANKKPSSPNKSKSFNGPVNGIAQSGHFSSTQDVHGNETNNDRIDFSHFGVHRTTSKEQIVPTTKLRHTSGGQTTTTTSVVAVTYTPGERHPSAQSYESRDPNVSYAYTNVRQYIEENALMSPEKEQIIRDWIGDVEKHRQYLQKIE